MKKKIVALCLVICLMAIAIVGGTLAYFTDTEAQTNTFTLGEVNITLAEPNYTGTAGVLHVYPGQTYTKDPTVTVDADSEDCYLVATVTVTNLADLKALYANDTTGVKNDWGLSLAGNGRLVSGGVSDYTPSTVSDGGKVGTMLNDGTEDVAFITYEEVGDTIVYTYYFKQIHSAGESEVLFDTVTIPSIIDNGDISGGTINITVNAYAIQEKGFADVYAAYAAYMAQEG